MLQHILRRLAMAMLIALGALVPHRAAGDGGVTVAFGDVIAIGGMRLKLAP